MATNLNPDEEGTAKRFWDKFSKESVLALYSPFFVSLASGNLKIETFRHFVTHDVHIYKCFDQICKSAAKDFAGDNHAEDSICEMRLLILTLRRYHESFGLDWCLDCYKEITPNPATTKYTNFVLATSSGKLEKTKVGAYTLSAMVPWMRLCVFLVNELQSVVDTNGNDDDNPYKLRITNYSSKCYQEAMDHAEDMLDELSVFFTGEEVDTMQKIYHQALKLGMQFFLAQPVYQQTVVPLLKQHNPTKHRLMIFSNFDSTCSVVNSCTILAELAIVTASKSYLAKAESLSQITKMPSADLRNTWEVLLRQYTQEYEQCIESMLSNEKVVDYDYEGLKSALEQLSEFQRKANMRVIESNLLKGLTLKDIKRAGQRLVLHNGCMGFFQNITNNKNLNVNVHVLSYCWCADLIKSAFSSGGIQRMQVHANEFEYENSVSTGVIIKKVESPIDKLRAFNDILKNSNENDKKKNLTVYIGDSVGDLLCLLEADIGLVIGSSSSLLRIGSQFGVSFVPLFHALIKKQKEHVEGSEFSWKRLSGVLYTVSSWAEVHSFIIGS